MKDPKSFEAVYREYFPGLMSFAAWLTGNQADAQEIVQDVFMKIWMKGSVSSADPRIKSYLYTAVKNKAMNVIRDRRKFLDPIEDEAAFLDYRMNAQELLEYNSLQQQVNFAIGKLPERCRMVFLLKRKEGLSHKEIAALMEISEKTVENQMTKAMRMIKDFLENNQN